MGNVSWMNHKLESRLLGENNNLRYADDSTLMAENEEELNSLLMKLKEESEKAGLKLNIQKTKIMVSSPITSWQTEGEKVKAVTDYFLGPQITAERDSSHGIKRSFAPWKESYDRPIKHMNKQRPHFADKGVYSRYGFSSNVWM